MLLGTVFWWVFDRFLQEMQNVNRQVWGQNFIKESNFSLKGFSNMWDQIPIFIILPPQLISANAECFFEASTRFQARIMLQNSFH